jgi:hypothetical protein
LGSAGQCALEPNPEISYDARSMEEISSDNAARRQRRGRLERFARSERIFPGGDHSTRHCGACARIIADRFGGEVRGYWHDDNPAASVGETEGGHDFAVTADRFLVEPWLYHYYGESPVLDMDVPADRAEVVARYGPEVNWKRVPGGPERVKSQEAQRAR